MLKRRLIPVLNILNGLIVRSEGFVTHQKIGNIINQASRYNEWEVDELIYLDISREKDYDLGRDDHKIQSYDKIEEIIQRISKVCFMPLAFGGGIKSIADVDLRIRNGADKVVINTKAFENPKFISEIADKYGRQAVVISVDYRMVNGIPIVFTEFGKKNSSKKVSEWILEAESRGAGEIFLNCIDRDGMGAGFDIKTIEESTMSLKIPLIACGGAGSPEDFIEVFKETSVSAVAAGNYFHFTERSYPRIKTELKREGIDVR